MPDANPVYAATSRVGAAPMIAALDGVRGVAVLLVFAVHYTVAWTLLFPHAATDATGTGLIADIVFSLGNAGVDLFMCLSGYLIYDHLMRKPQRFGAYFGRRARRIFPPYLVVLAIYVVLMLIDPHKSKLPADTVAAVIYIVECALLVPAFFGHEPIVGIAWSLTYEMLFYLLLPLLIVVTGLRQRGFGTRLVVLAAVALAILVYGWHVQFHERTVMFVAGMVARECLLRWSYAFPRPRVFEGLAIAALCIALAYMAFWRGGQPFTNPGFPHSFDRALFLAVGFSALLAAALGVGGVSRAFLEFGPFRWLGEVSYSFYLLHNLTMRVMIGFLSRHVAEGVADRFYFLAAPACFVLCLLPGLTLYILVERPFSLRRPVGFLRQRGHALLPTASV
jgi:peptidoglycan/LPS O-acetylase OafA/YrhL